MSETDAQPFPAPSSRTWLVARHERSAPAVTLTREGGRASGDPRRPTAPGARPRSSHARSSVRAPLAHPALVWDVAIGQSTLVTGRVIANLFYRGLVLQRTPVIGDTLHSTEVARLRQKRRDPVRRATGLAALRVRTHDQDARPCSTSGAARCCRCAIPGRGAATTSRDRRRAELRRAARARSAGWRLDACRRRAERLERSRRRTLELAWRRRRQQRPRAGAADAECAAAHHDRQPSRATPAGLRRPHDRPAAAQ